MIPQVKSDVPGGYSEYKKLGMLEKLIKSPVVRNVSTIVGVLLGGFLLYNTYLSIKINKKELAKREEEEEKKTPEPYSELK